jgi:hypothetical protein
MFTDPIGPITINSVAHSLARVETSGKRSVYQNADGTVVLEISHQLTGKNRHRSTLRLTWQKIVIDPLTAANDYDSVTLTRIIDRPMAGFSLAEVQSLVSGIDTWDTDAVEAKLFGQES